MAKIESTASDSSMARSFTPLMAWALALGCTVGWGAFVMPGTTFLPQAGPLGTALAFLVGTVAMLVVAGNFGYMARLHPGEGGVYRYVRERFGPNHAFVCSWCLVLAYGAAMVANATALALVVRSAVGPFMQVGPHYMIAGYEVTLGEAVSGMIVIALAAMVCMRSSYLSGVVVTVFALGLALGTVAILVLALASPQVTLAATAPAFSPYHSTMAGVLTVLASVPWAFVGFEAATQVSDECNFSMARYARIMGAAILCGAVMYLTYNTVAAALVPEGYDSWVPYLEDLPNQQGLVALPTFYSGYALAGNAGVALYFVTALCGVLSGVVGFYITVTRLIHAMADDRSLPTSLARTHPRFETPARATMVVLGIAIFLPFIGRNVLNWVLDLMSLGALIAYLYVSIAVLRHARLTGRSLASLMGLLGVIISVVCIALLIIPLPGLSTSLSKESYVILLAWVALGVNFYTPTLEY